MQETKSKQAYILRDWKPTDAAAKAAFTNHPEILKWLWDGVPNPYTESDAAQWLERVLALSTDRGHEWAIVNEADVPVGTIGYTVGEGMRRYTCEVGYFLDPACWGQGIATWALSEVCRRIFDETPAQRIFAEVYSGNAASCRVLEKAGFYHECTQRRAVVKNGEMMDLEIYALLRNAPKR